MQDGLRGLGESSEAAPAAAAPLGLLRGRAQHEHWERTEGTGGRESAREGRAEALGCNQKP